MCFQISSGFVDLVIEIQVDMMGLQVHDESMSLKPGGKVYCFMRISEKVAEGGII
jgi:hypothetical protein